MEDPTPQMDIPALALTVPPHASVSPASEDFSGQS